MLLDYIRNKTIFADKYKSHSEAVIIACYFNPHNSPSRISAFNHFYNSIRHLNHRIVECVIGDAQPQLVEDVNISRIYTRDLLWHKEALLNQIISTLPQKFKYVFWLDTDIIFTNPNWMVEGVRQLQINNIIQPFKYCVHLEKDELKPSFDLGILDRLHLPNQENRKVWRSFCANFVDTDLWQDPAYDRHGHVGFAWGARRAVLDKIQLYDRALIGGADHIIAHAAAGQISHSCIARSFTDNLAEVEAWSREFHSIVQGKIGYVEGGLYHIWHGDIAKRDYLRRIQNFTPLSKNILRRDRNGLFETDDVAVVEYVEDYFDRREVTEKAPDSTGDENICQQLLNINTREADRCSENFS